MKPEERWLSNVLMIAKIHGWRTAHFRPARTTKGWRTAVGGDGVGYPDLTLVRERVIVAELKAGKNKTSEEQDAWLKAFAQAGIESYTWYPTDIDQVIRVLSSKAAS